jgi:outer membrane protein insertion porin family
MAGTAITAPHPNNAATSTGDARAGHDISGIPFALLCESPGYFPFRNVSGRGFLYFLPLMRLSWLILVVSLCGVASAQFVEDVANSALETSKIRAVRYEGLLNVDESAVRSRVQLDVGQALTPANLAGKVKASVTSLYESGLFDDVTAWYDYSQERQDELDVVFRFVELPALDTFSIEGNDVVTAEDLQTKISLIPGRVYNRSQLERSRQAILSHYKSEGFLLAEVGVKESPVDEGKMHVTFTVTEGEKVVIQSITVSGNPHVPQDEIVSGMGLELNTWYGSGEFKEEAFEAARDSVLMVCKSKGFLDAALTKYEAQYLPDSSFKFYLGRMVGSSHSLKALNQQLTQDIADQKSAMHLLAGRTYERGSHYFRKFRKGFSPAGQALPVPVITTEEQALEILNRIITSSELRGQWIDALPDRKWTPAIDSLLSLKTRNGFEDRRLARLTLEETYPALQTWDSIKTSTLVNINIGIDEGHRYYAGSIHFSGNEILPTPLLKSIVQNDSGSIFDFRAYEATKKNIMDAYREDGYLFARLEERRDFQDSIVHLTFDITEGLPAIIRRVTIKGNTRTKDKVIRREIKLFPGDTYRQSLMERSFRDVFQLNYFDNLTPDIQPVQGSEQDIDLVFHASEKEAGTGTFSAGLAYSARDGLVGTLGLSMPNCCMGDGQRADVNLEYGTDKKNVTLSFSEPWFLDRPTNWGGSVNYTWTKGVQADANIIRYGASTFLGSRLSFPDDYFYGQMDYSFQRYMQGDNIPGSLIVNSGYSSTVGASIIRDDKNLPMFPNDGSRLTASISKAGIGLQDFRYWKSDLSLKWWFPIFEVNHQTLALGITNEYGFIVGDALQYSSLYQMGGALGYQGLLRGYTPGSIGYRRLGRSYQFMSAELTYPLAENRFYLLPLFFDAGNVFGKRYDPSQVVPGKDLPAPTSEWDPSSLKRDFGFGFRVIVPMLGIIGFDFAWPLDPGESFGGYNYTTVGGMQFNFLIGQGF